jgi:hypothetical protein
MTEAKKPDPLLRIPHLYHFADRRNLESIQKHGLCPLATLQAQSIAIPAPGGNELSHELDATLGLDKYVHLALVYSHPMKKSAKDAGRIVDAVTLKIDRAVLGWPGVLFSPDIANKTGVPTYALADAVAAEMIDFRVLYTWMDWRNPDVQERRQRSDRCEILVPHCIPPELVLKVLYG